MTLFTAWLLGLDTTPSPVPEFTGDPNAVTPGVIGFVAIFLIAVATVLLILDMTRRVRRVRYREEIRERLEAEAAGDVPPATKPAPGD
ncbi:hypothetical protein BH10ACT7_BH10ACT7_15530 [soil metagenome]